MINIAIDGHVCSGKSTLARALARKLGYHVLDTGAIYRGLACAYRDRGLRKINEEEIKRFVDTVNVKVAFDGQVQRVIVNDKDYTPYLREEEISILSSKISPYPYLREKVLSIQRDFAKKYNCILEGRDIGTVVLPDADVKFFVTARPEIRAKRRAEQLNDKSITFEQVLKDLEERDYKDEHRAVAPLKVAPDAIVLDTSDDTLDETMDKCIRAIKQNR